MLSDGLQIKNYSYLCRRFRGANTLARITKAYNA